MNNIFQQSACDLISSGGLEAAGAGTAVLSKVKTIRVMWEVFKISSRIKTNNGKGVLIR